MTAEVEGLKSEKATLSAKLNTKLKELQKKRSSQGGKDDQKYAWKKIAPTDGQKKNGREYHWCGKHKAWTIHKQEDCKMKESEGETEPTATGMSATIDRGDDDSESSF